MRSCRFRTAEAALCLALACAAPEPLVPVEDGRVVMATTLDIALVVPAGDRARAREQVARALASAEELEAVASRWLPESDVSELARRAGRSAVPVDARVHALLARAEEGRRITGGAFDVSVGPLVELWTRAAARGELPGTDEIRAARLRTGREVALFADGRAALPEPGMSVDLGGIAKGFAIDEIAAALRAAGLARGLLSFGESSVWALGTPPDASRWRLAIRDDSGRILGAVVLVDQALSISSSLGSSSEIAGRRYGHVVDPRTGLALSERRLAVVVARDATLAEVLSTALLILSEADGARVVEAQGAEAWVVGERGSEWKSRGFERLWVPGPPV
jgi:thiamine biosynthesis lipoprotein